MAWPSTSPQAVGNCCAPLLAAGVCCGGLKGLADRGILAGARTMNAMMAAGLLLTTTAYAFAFKVWEKTRLLAWLTESSMDG